MGKEEDTTKQCRNTLDYHLKKQGRLVQVLDQAKTSIDFCCFFVFFFVTGLQVKARAKHKFDPLTIINNVMDMSAL